MQPEDLKRVQNQLSKMEKMGEGIGSSLSFFYRLIRTKIAVLVALIVGGVFVMAFSVAKGMRK